MWYFNTFMLGVVTTLAGMTAFDAFAYRECHECAPACECVCPEGLLERLSEPNGHR
jgi:hypothetical protein